MRCIQFCRYFVARFNGEPHGERVYGFLKVTHIFKSSCQPKISLDEFFVASDAGLPVICSFLPVREASIRGTPVRVVGRYRGIDFDGFGVPLDCLRIILLFEEIVALARAFIGQYLKAGTRGRCNERAKCIIIHSKAASELTLSWLLRQG